MQVRRTGWNIGVKSVAAAIAVALAVCGVLPASAEDTTSTGNRVFFRGGYAALSSGRGGELFTDGHNAAGQNDETSGYYVGSRDGSHAHERRVGHDERDRDRGRDWSGIQTVQL